MKSKLSILLILLLGISIPAQSFDTGTIGIEVNDFGRIRVHKPAIGTRQIDRSSILVGVGETAVFDYTNDADNEIPFASIATPPSSDFQVYGAVNNNFSNNPPDVVVDMNVYGWTNGAYALAHFMVKNLEAAPITAIIGIEILPQIENAYGDYFILLDSDDMFEPTIIEEMANAAEKDSPDFIVCDYYERNTENNEMKLIELKGNIFNSVAGGILFLKSKIAGVGGYDESMVFPEYDVLMKLLNAGAKYAHIQRPLLIYNRGPDCITSDKKIVMLGMKQLKDKYGEIKGIRKY